MLHRRDSLDVSCKGPIKSKTDRVIPLTMRPLYGIDQRVLPYPHDSNLEVNWPIGLTWLAHFFLDSEFFFCLNEHCIPTLGSEINTDR
jgi:hypothetical protein